MIPTWHFLGTHPCHVSFSMKQVKILKSSWLHSLSLTTWSILLALLPKYTQNLTSFNHSHNGSLVQTITASDLTAYLASILLGLLPSVCGQHSSWESIRYKSIPMTPCSPLSLRAQVKDINMDLDLDGLPSLPLSPPLLWSSEHQPYLPLFCTSYLPSSFKSQGIRICCALWRTIPQTLSLLFFRSVFRVLPWPAQFKF